LHHIDSECALLQDLEAVKALEDAPTPEMAITFIGLVGIRDPPRKVRHRKLCRLALHPPARAVAHPTVPRPLSLPPIRLGDGPATRRGPSANPQRRGDW
jgi:hypothetical protein